MNNIILTGRLTRDVELLGEMQSYLRNALAVKSSFKSKNGEYKTDFFNFVAFNKTAEIINSYCYKGALVLIKGHLTTNTMKNDKGIDITIIELIADEVELLESKKQQENVGYNNNNSNNYNNNNFNNDDSPFKDVKSQFDINSSDLPF